jgi:hypothetical protein
MQIREAPSAEIGKIDGRHQQHQSRVRAPRHSRRPGIGITSDSEETFIFDCSCVIRDADSSWACDARADNGEEISREGRKIYHVLRAGDSDRMAALSSGHRRNMWS